jgi:hypothetical protein
VISLVVGLIILGVLLWLVETMLPIDAAFKTIIRVVVILAALIWVARALGVF